MFVVLVDLQAEEQLAGFNEMEVIKHAAENDGTLILLSDSSWHIIHFKLITLWIFLRTYKPSKLNSGEKKLNTDKIHLSIWS